MAAAPPLRVAAHPVWRELRARSRELASLLVDDDAGAVEARVLEARFYELERADVKVVEAFSRDECAKVAVALDDLGAFADGAGLGFEADRFGVQRVPQRPARRLCPRRRRARCLPLAPAVLRRPSALIIPGDRLVQRPRSLPAALSCS